MENDLPACEDFLIKAIRMMRGKDPKNKTGAKAPVSLISITAIALQKYQLEDVRTAIQQLAASNKLLVAAERKTIGADETWGYAETVRIAKLPNDFSAPHHFRWATDKDNNCVDEHSGIASNLFYNAKMYVIEDGLPKRYRCLVYGRSETKNKITADSILAAMEKEKKALKK